MPVPCTKVAPGIGHHQVIWVYALDEGAHVINPCLHPEKVKPPRLILSGILSPTSEPGSHRVAGKKNIGFDRISRKIVVTRATHDLDPYQPR